MERFFCVPEQQYDQSTSCDITTVAAVSFISFIPGLVSAYCPARHGLPCICKIAKFWQVWNFF